MQAVKKEDITPAVKYYFDAITGPFKSYINEARGRSFCFPVLR